MITHKNTQNGMTLVEVVLAMAIFSITVLWTLSTLMGVVAANRITTSGISANATIRAMAEEVQSVAVDWLELNQGKFGVYGDRAAAVLHYYATEYGSLDANGFKTEREDRVTNVTFDSGNARLVVRFSIPEPGASPYSTESTKSKEAVLPKPAKAWDRGYGEMVLYLHEEDVPTNHDSTILWEDLGSQGGDRTRSGANVASRSGFDINGDGVIKDFAVDAGDLKTAAGISKLGVVSLPIDINVYYFRDRIGGRLMYDATRRLVITGTGSNEYQ